MVFGGWLLCVGFLFLLFGLFLRCFGVYFCGALGKIISFILIWSLLDEHIPHNIR